MDVYSSHEIARAIGGGPVDVDGYVTFDEAVRIGRDALAARRRDVAPLGDEPLFSLFLEPHDAGESRRVPFVVSTSLHALLVAVIILVTAGLTPTTAISAADTVAAEPTRLVFLAIPGPGGGGGGGGHFEKQAPPKIMRQGTHKISSPVPDRQPKIAPVAPQPPKPEPPLQAESLPTMIAPIAPAPADAQNRVGVVEETKVQSESRGPGGGGGTGSGVGTGIGEGNGPGLGPGSGGGTGGGPFRPGSGVEPPTLVREVKAAYTEEARQRGITGEVILEIVVRRDGSVGDIRILKGLAGGLNDRAVQAVRQWRFSPGRRQGTPVDVQVEVSVEFRQR